ncbi:FecR family protein [Chitinophaga qingshengii]|uniref:FecR domain-containing protein n=1 Tax=Chitinophaga qingshengii TaxID=1569794 RepID=A0ABR7TG30_9BACT|nr:FecR domain-containing protein [Chitinophaga qingshengii]MBC9928848.1 FecR domain-containing protein [Chitinophaga qingshengii]
MKNLTFLFQLMTEKKAGIISAADEALLDAYMEEIPEAREMWELIESGQQLRQPAHWRNTYSIADSQAGPPLIKWGIAASMFLAVFCVSWYYLFQGGVHLAAEPAPIAAFPGATLTLADGSVHQLPGSPGTVDIGGQQLPLQAGVLSLQTAIHLPSGQNTLAVPQDSHYKITLADGSEIWLNASTTLQFPFEFRQSTRETLLTGEAYFRIAANPNKPFILKLPNSTVQVLGTSFHVNTYDPHHIRISLTEGSIRITAGTRQVVLRPGQQAVYNDSTHTLDVQHFDEQQADAWRKKQFYFTSVTLAGLKSITMRRYGQHGVIDPSGAIHKPFIVSPDGEPLSAGILLPGPHPASDSMQLYQ